MGHHSMAARNVTLSPDGFEYRYLIDAPAGQRLSRRTPPATTWGMGMPTFSIQHISAEELRFVAALIDEARSGKQVS